MPMLLKENCIALSDGKHRQIVPVPCHIESTNARKHITLRLRKCFKTSILVCLSLDPKQGDDALVADLGEVSKDTTKPEGMSFSPCSATAINPTLRDSTFDSFNPCNDIRVIEARDTNTMPLFRMFESFIECPTGFRGVANHYDSVLFPCR